MKQAFKNRQKNEAAFFAVGLLVLSAIMSMTCYQWRITGFVGTGEIGLLISSVYFVRYYRLIVAGWIFLIYWALFLASICAGTFVAFHLGILFAGTLRFAATAFFAAGLTILFYIAFQHIGAELVRDIVMACFGGMSILLLTYAYLPIGEMSKWYFEPGFYYMGLDTNPNQLAAFCVPIPFIVMHSSGSVFRTVSAFCATSLAVLTGSTAALLALLSGGGIALVAATRFGSEAKKRVLILCGVIALAYATTLGASNLIWRSGSGSGSCVYILDDDSRGVGCEFAERFSLWANGLKAGSRSPITGLGMGFYSGFEKPFEGISAHNTFIDVFTMGGIVGLIAFGGLMATIFVKLFRSGNSILLGAMVALVTCMFFGSVLVQPYIWLLLVYFYFMAQEDVRGKNAETAAQTCSSNNWFRSRFIKW